MAYNYLENYFARLFEILKNIRNSQAGIMQEAAEVITESVASGGIVHIAGTGHSHMLAEEVFARAGGLAAVNAILEPSLMLHTGALKSSFTERLSGYGTILLNYYKVEPKDVLIVVSNSGANTVPVEMALVAKERGIKTIALTSLSYSRDVQARHPSGKKLYQVADIVIDNQGTPGDAIVKVEGLEQSVGASSTVAGAAILNAIFVQVAANLVDKGITPPIFISNKIKGADKHNARIVQKYRDRVKHF